MLFQAAQKLFGMAARLALGRPRNPLGEAASYVPRHRCLNRPSKPVRLNRMCESSREYLVCSA